MKLLNSAIFGCMALIIALPGSALANGVTQFKEHQSWNSMIVSDGKNTFYRSGAVGTDHGFFIDRRASSCDFAWPNVNILKINAGADVIEPAFYGELRIDNRPTRSFDGSLEWLSNKSGLINLDNIGPTKSLIDEIKTGKKIQFSFFIDKNNPIVWTYDLTGATQALQRALNLCEDSA